MRIEYWNLVLEAILLCMNQMLYALCLLYHSNTEAVLFVCLWWWWCYPTPSEGWGAWRNITETQQLGHTPRSGPEVKNRRSSAKDSASERLGCGTIQEEVSQILQRVPQVLHEEFSFRFILHR